MRPFKTILLLFLTVSACTQANCQLKNSQRFTLWEGGLCDETIILDSLGYFFKEKGCEGNSTVSFGNYKVSKGNIVSFKSLPLDSLRPFKNVHRNKDTSNGRIMFTLIDEDGKELRKIYNYQGVDVNGQKVELWTDERDFIIHDSRIYKAILKPLVIGEENEIVVHLNIPTMILAYDNITFEKTYLKALYLKKDGLYRLDKKTKIYTRN